MGADECREGAVSRAAIDSGLAGDGLLIAVFYRLETEGGARWTGKRTSRS